MSSERKYRVKALTRRQFILLGGAAAFFPALGVNLYSDIDRMIIRILEKHLPGIEFESSSLKVFVEESHVHIASLPRRLAAFVSVHLADGFLPEKVREKFENMERMILTDFLLGSDFFRLPNPESRPVKYFGKTGACGNPFATLS